MVSKIYLLTGPAEGASFHLDDNRVYRVGRGPNNDIQINDKDVSRYHLKIQKELNKYLITDLMSKNGTFAGDKETKPGVEVEVDEGVPIVIGMTAIGLGEISKSCLKPFLASIGMSREQTQSNNVSRPVRINTIKRNLEFIYRTKTDLETLTDPDKLYEKLIDNIFNLLKRIDRCAVVLTDTYSGKISKVVCRSKKAIDKSEEGYDRELVKHTLQQHKAVMVADSSNENGIDQRLTESLNLKNIRSAMCVPINSCFQERGAIYIDSLERPYGFRRNDFALIKDIGHRVGLAMDSMILNESLMYKN